MVQHPSNNISISNNNIFSFAWLETFKLGYGNCFNKTFTQDKGGGGTRNYTLSHYVAYILWGLLLNIDWLVQLEVSRLLRIKVKPFRYILINIIRFHHKNNFNIPFFLKCSSSVISKDFFFFKERGLGGKIKRN